ncbi:hypothetical protein GCM10010441_13700 [Kitasatospora paracochleata]|uniref:Uncharacterized protein n=1 Tax=Kitasatospora paracochleata TaxID=58354 RepID=A0ABT1JAQ0_9ACTN|nr:DUF6624 domain-containing protein [Kitasatospora paracochleata]MCP2314532.1 hypothetical protein [Kitasatospora paracochleata]
MASDVATAAAELTAMVAADHQAARQANSDDPAEQLAWRRLTARHADRLSEIMDAHGWPTADLVGEEAARAAWLIAQHADRQLDVQRRALRLMEQAVADGAASPRDLAFLRDRTLVNEGQKQIYGTQIAGVREGSPIPWPCEDPEHMDERREEVGIPPFSEYVAQFSPA